MKTMRGEPARKDPGKHKETGQVSAVALGERTGNLPCHIRHSLSAYLICFALLDFSLQESRDPREHC